MNKNDLKQAKKAHKQFETEKGSISSNGGINSCFTGANLVTNGQSSNQSDDHSHLNSASNFDTSSMTSSINYSTLEEVKKFNKHLDVIKDTDEK
ncbi:MAG: hypothetical protein ACREVX_15560 [Clostridium sp.]|uniref:hypothetical protein n=1 Tax=Clostridium sp. TaxID=1506 RepID=UPI003D6C8799